MHEMRDARGKRNKRAAGGVRREARRGAGGGRREVWRRNEERGERREEREKRYERREIKEHRGPATTQRSYPEVLAFPSTSPSPRPSLLFLSPFPCRRRSQTSQLKLCHSACFYFFLELWPSSFFCEVETVNTRNGDPAPHTLRVVMFAQKKKALGGKSFGW